GPQISMSNTPGARFGGFVFGLGASALTFLRQPHLSRRSRSSGEASWETSSSLRIQLVSSWVGAGPHAYSTCLLWRIRLVRLVTFVGATAIPTSFGLAFHVGAQQVRSDTCQRVHTTRGVIPQVASDEHRAFRSGRNA